MTLQRRPLNDLKKKKTHTRQQQQQQQQKGAALCNLKQTNKQTNKCDPQHRLSIDANKWRLF